MFEALGCGALLLTNFIHGNGFDELFREKRHLALYRGPDEMFRLAGRYLNNEGERLAIAKEGQKLAADRFTYDGRVKEILKYA
jgi:spore maturation protein CgeB